MVIGSRFDALFRRRAAVHEAGHLLIGIHEGLRVIGAEIEGADGRVYVIEPRRRQKSAARVRYSVAGEVAAVAWFKSISGARPFEAVEWLDHLYEPNSMSESDWKGCFCAPGEPDAALALHAKAVADLLWHGPLWPALCATSRVLMAKGSISRDQAAQLMPGLSVAA